jgi:hypothetical protein
MSKLRAGPNAIVAVMLLGVYGMALAHHSNAMFDKSNVREVSAVVREFQWTNPHVWIEVTIETDEGDKQEWSIEGGGPNSLFRKGWKPNSFQAGDVVSLKIYPMRDGSFAALFVAARFADGTTLGSW